MLNSNDLTQIARTLVAPGKGILAADESSSTIEKRLNKIKVVSTDESRRAYREVLLAAPGLGQFISGVILYDETLRQSAANGTPFPTVLQGAGIIPGIKVDKGTKALAGFPDDTITEGLDGLRERLKEYHSLGARFTKWRAVFRIAPKTPSRTAIKSNAEALARFAALSQENGLVPIVEPEVLMDGSHDLARCAEVTEHVLRIVFSALARHHVQLEAMLLKPNMVIPGEDCPPGATPDEIATATLTRLRRTVPAAVPGIVFLSGGQSDVEATVNLNAINQPKPQPWELSFSYGRALQTAALEHWAGKAENVAAAREALLHRARCLSAARDGNYTPGLER